MILFLKRSSFRGKCVKRVRMSDVVVVVVVVVVALPVLYIIVVGRAVDFVVVYVYSGCVCVYVFFFFFAFLSKFRLFYPASSPPFVPYVVCLHFPPPVSPLYSIPILPSPRYFQLTITASLHTFAFEYSLYRVLFMLRPHWARMYS